MCIQYHLFQILNSVLWRSSRGCPRLGQACLCPALPQTPSGPAREAGVLPPFHHDFATDVFMGGGGRSLANAGGASAAQMERDGKQDLAGQPLCQDVLVIVRGLSKGHRGFY